MAKLWEYACNIWRIIWPEEIISVERKYLHVFVLILIMIGVVTSWSLLKVASLERAMIDYKTTISLDLESLANAQAEFDQTVAQRILYCDYKVDSLGLEVEANRYGFGQLVNALIIYSAEVGE